MSTEAVTLPTTPGSVIEAKPPGRKKAFLMALTTEGQWQRLDGPITERGPFRDVRVLFDAAALVSHANHARIAELEAEIVRHQQVAGELTSDWFALADKTPALANPAWAGAQVTEAAEPNLEALGWAEEANGLRADLSDLRARISALADETGSAFPYVQVRELRALLGGSTDE